jgi:release factor glutamine methyltransferase
MTYSQIFRSVVQRLAPSFPPDEARALAVWLLEETTGLTRTQMLRPETDLQPPRGLERLVSRLCQGEPVQYVFGHTFWRGLDLQLTPATLIPRPETSELIDWVLADFPDTVAPLRVLDAGTGSGCIALALKQARPHWDITAVDISPAALRVARRNARRNGLSVRWVCADILDEASWKEARWDILVSNPPYVRESEKASMQASVLRYEPSQALFVPDSDPLLFYRALVSAVVAPMLYFEINEALHDDTAALMRRYGCEVRTRLDIYGKPRMLRAGSLQ